MVASLFERILNFKKSEIFIIFILFILIALVFICLPFIDPNKAENLIYAGKPYI